MYQMCGDCQNSLAQQHLQYEIDVEKRVLEPLQAIVEVITCLIDISLCWS